MSKWPSVSTRFLSFDGSTVVTNQCFAPDRYRFWTGNIEFTPALSRGAGLSYVAGSFSRSLPTVNHRFFNRLLDFDSSSGLLEVEAGVTLGQIYDFAVSRGWMLAVQPGHPAITIGGCIAADVHGKNQWRDGTFVSQVESISLFHPLHGVLELSRENNAEIFELTCGGYGLTGNILSAKIHLTRILGNSVQLQRHQIPSLLDLSKELPRAAKQHSLIYSWHNLTKRSHRLGEGFIITGDFQQDDRESLARPPLRLAQRSALSATRRAAWPFSFFNKLTVPTFNNLYHAFVRSQSTKRSISVYDFLFPVHDKEIYFYLFGRQGFCEYQLIIPHNRFEEFAEAIRERLQHRLMPVTLASAKLFGGKRTLLRFSGEGICLALNYPRTGQAEKFSRFLDELMQSCGGWPNLIKDSRLNATVVAAAYPEYDDFRRRLREFDPQRCYRSELSERLAL